MADTVTPNYNMTKPEVGSSANTWGGKTNGNWDIMDTGLKEVSDKANEALPNTRAVASNLNAAQFLEPGVYGINGAVSNGPLGQIWGPLLVLRFSDVAFQIIGHSSDNPQLFFRAVSKIGMTGQAVAYGPWRTYGNISNSQNPPSGGADGDIHLQW